MNSQSLRQHAQGLDGAAPGHLCVYNGFQFSVLMGFLSVRMSGSLILVPAVGILFLLYCCNVQCHMIVLASSLLTWLYFIVIS